MAKGMILAAGQGTRVRPLTKDLPKAMVPILGKPVMEYLIEHLARHGITEIMINVAYHHKKIEEYFGDGRRWGVSIGYAFKGMTVHGDILPRPKGSAGGMKAIQDFGGFFDETTLVLCGDAIIDLDIGSQLFPLMAEQGLPFYAQSRFFNWIDIGRVTDYWSVLQRVLRGEVATMEMPGKEIEPGVWVGPNTGMIAAGCAGVMRAASAD